MSATDAASAGDSGRASAGTSARTSAATSAVTSARTPAATTARASAATSARNSAGTPARTKAEWPLYEVFVRGKRGLNHVHVGSLRAADDDMALLHARDLYTRRNEGVSIWAVRSDTIAASTPGEKDPFFAPSGDKVYRHPTFYDIPDDVPHI